MWFQSRTIAPCEQGEKKTLKGSQPERNTDEVKWKRVLAWVGAGTVRHQYCHQAAKRPPSLLPGLLSKHVSTALRKSWKISSAAPPSDCPHRGPSHWKTLSFVRPRIPILWIKDNTRIGSRAPILASSNNAKKEKMGECGRKTRKFKNTHQKTSHYAPDFFSLHDHTTRHRQGKTFLHMRKWRQNSHQLGKGVDSKQFSSGKRVYWLLLWSQVWVMPFDLDRTIWSTVTHPSVVLYILEQSPDCWDGADVWVL